MLRWSQEMDDAFQALKEHICEDVKLSFPDYSEEAAPLELYVDASDVGAGACLTQRQVEDVRIIAYGSTTFAASERHYSTIAKELAALRWGVKAMRPFLVGTEFIIHTDHQPLIYLQNMKIIDSRLARTLEDLSDFSFRIQYTPGKHNTAADALSRLYNPDNVHYAAEEMEPGKLPAGLVVVREVPGGGNSLFQSLHLLSLEGGFRRSACDSVLQLRELLIDDILKRPSFYKISLDKDRRRQLRLMRTEGQLPGVEVLYAFGELFDCCVAVHFGGSTPVNFIPPSFVTFNETSKRIHLQCLAGVHYNPVAELRGYEWKCEEFRGSLPLAAEAEEQVDEDAPCDDSDDLVEVAVVDQLVEVTSDWCCKHKRNHQASLMVTYKDQRFCVLVDSGAQVSCVAESIAKENAIEIDASARVTVVGLGSIRSSALGMVDLALTFPSSIVLEVQSVVVVPDAAIPYCIVLGADFLISRRVTLKPTELYSGQTHSSLARLEVPGSMACADETLGKGVETGDGWALSVVAHDGDATDDGQINSDQLLCANEVRKLQQKSSVIREVKKQLQSGVVQAWPAPITKYKRHREELSIKDNILIHRGVHDVVPVVTFQVLVEIMVTVHAKLAHIGRQKLIELVRRQVWNPSIAKVAADITSSCDVCQHRKVSPIIAPPMHRVQTSTPFELLTMDLLSLPRSNGYLVCLVTVDHNSKWLSAVPLRGKTSEEVASVFITRILPSLPRCPDRILTDNGPEFVGTSFNEALSQYGIVHAYTTPNKPPSNGLAERTIRTLSEILRVETGSEECERWSEVLPKAIIVYNNTHHAALEMSPAEYILQKPHASRSRWLLPEEETSKWKEGSPSFGSFKVGDRVLKKTVLRGNLTTNKFKERFEGPFEVIKVNQNGITYQIRECETGSCFRAHHGQLKKYIQPPKYLVRHPAYSMLQGGDGERLGDLIENEGVPVGLGGWMDQFSLDTSSEGSFHGFASRESLGWLGSESANSEEPQSEGHQRLAAHTREDLPEMVDNPLLKEYPLVSQVNYNQIVFIEEEELEPVSRRESMLPVAREHPAGIVMEREETFWDMAEGRISSPAAEMTEECLSLEVDVSQELNESQLGLGLRSDSFSGFREGDLGGVSLSEHLQQIENMVVELKRRMTQEGIPSSGRARSPIVTRSRGAVRNLPNVQQWTLEYHRRGSQGKSLKQD